MKICANISLHLGVQLCCENQSKAYSSGVITTVLKPAYCHVSCHHSSDIS